MVPCDAVPALPRRCDSGRRRYRGAARIAAAGASTDLIESPDTSSAEENRVRAAVLARYRGYREDRELFEGYPAGVR